MIQITSLPAELCTTILRYAATPSFTVESTNPYSSALTLCLVSKIVRLVVIPELLHTVFLPSNKHVMTFVHALHMQRVYAQEENHLYVDYAAQVSNIWMEKIGDNRKRYRYHYINTDFSLLAPVVLAAKSLQVAYDFMPLLNGCLEYAWKAGTHSNTDHTPSPLPWSVETLTLCHPDRDLASYSRHSQRQYSFLTCVSSILVRKDLSLTKTVGRENTFHYKTPERPYNPDTPWACLKNLRFVSFGLPHQHYFYNGVVTRPVRCGKDLCVELLKEISDTCHDGRLLSVECRATVTCSTDTHNYDGTSLIWSWEMCNGVKV